MPRFRPLHAGPSAAAEPVSTGAVRRLIEEVFAPGHFFAAPPLALEWEHVAAEEIFWEVFRGRLLDPAHTRERRRFEAWNVYATTAAGRAEGPLLALKLDADAAQLHVVRGIESYAWEGYDAGGNVYLSRERRKWVRELAGTIHLERFRDTDELRDELICRLFRAVVGASRLPLASVEAPLPAFSFGELLYCYRPGAAGGPLCSYHELIRDMLTPPLNRLERAKLLEVFLRAVPGVELAAAAGLFAERWSALGQTSADLVALLRLLFNEVSLSPYTDFVDKTLLFLAVLQERGDLSAEQVVGFLGHLLRQIGRHLTAYDLVTFHHRGANYPDALLLDAVLRAYLSWVERRPDLFAESAEEGEAARHTKRLRRRALRQGWLLRRRYEGHPVPDLPTSPGENSRVLPPSHPRVPEEQVLQAARRTRRLFADDPLSNHLGGRAREMLLQSLADLRHPGELRELGLALFLDRPFGTGKEVGEPDATLLLACEAFSRSVAEERLQALAGDPGLPESVDLGRLREGLSIPGLPLDAVGGASRPGAVSLADIRMARPDFVLLRTTPGGVAELLERYDFTPLAGRFNLDYLTVRRRVLLARSASGPEVTVYDAEFRPRLELEVPTEFGYESRAGHEYPAGGLRVLRVWEEEGGGLVLHDLRAEPLRVPAR